MYLMLVVRNLKNEEFGKNNFHQQKTARILLLTNCQMCLCISHEKLQQILISSTSATYYRNSNMTIAITK